MPESIHILCMILSESLSLISIHNFRLSLTLFLGQKINFHFLRIPALKLSQVKTSLKPVKSYLKIILRSVFS